MIAAMTPVEVLEARAVPLMSLSTITVSGADARTFLQGQLSNDLRKLRHEHALLATCNSSQGRVQAVLTLIQRGEAVVMVVASAMVGRVIARLQRYVLRSKAILTESHDLLAASLSAAEARGAATDNLPTVPGDCITQGTTTVMRWWSADERYLVVAPREELPASGEPLADLRWRRADIFAGMPQIYPETHELFVAQMLNVDLLGGISFDKGCYTGQEIVARTQYRGTIKRRMLRFTADCAVPPPGTRVLHAGAHCGEVVDACIGEVRALHACELLAVVSLDRAAESLELDGIRDSALTRVGLPYSLPPAAATPAAV